MSLERDVEMYEQDRQQLAREAEELERESASLERDGEEYNQTLETSKNDAISRAEALFKERSQLKSELERLQQWRSRTWNEPVGGGDSAGNPVTIAFGEVTTTSENQTMIADGDQSDSRDDEVQSFTNFREHENHNHYGSGGGPHENAKDRGRYTGPGH